MKKVIRIGNRVKQTYEMGSAAYVFFGGAPPKSSLARGRRIARMASKSGTDYGPAAAPTTHRARRLSSVRSHNGEGHITPIMWNAT